MTNYWEILKERQKLLQLIKHPEMLQLIREKSIRDPKYFINMFCWTYDPDKRPADLPFILYPFQEKYVDWMENLYKTKDDGLTDKSRKMGATWMGMAFILCKFLYDKGFTGHLGSQKEDYVDKAHDIKTLFGKIRYMLYRLPEEMLPKGFNERYHSSFMKLYNPENGNLITGESANKNFGRQARTSLTWMDEFAHWEHDEDSWTSVYSVSQTKFLVSTPKGRYSCFARLRWHSKINIISLPWKLHPERNQEWYDKEKHSGKYTSKEFAQEVDIDYSGSSGFPVIPEFEEGKNVKDYEFNPELPLMRSVDFGRRHPSLTFFQQAQDGKLYQIYELMGKEVGTFDWGLIGNYIAGVPQKPEIIDRIRYLCDNNKVEGLSNIAHLKTFPSRSLVDFCDQAGGQKTANSNQTGIEILTSLGYKPQYRWSHIKEGLAVLSKVFIQQLFYLTPACVLTKQGFEGGYRNDEQGKPLKDGFYDNLIDGVRYCVQEIFSYLDKKGEEPKPLDAYEKMIQSGVPYEYVMAIKESNRISQPDSLQSIREKSHNTGYHLGG